MNPSTLIELAHSKANKATLDDVVMRLDRIIELLSPEAEPEGCQHPNGFNTSVMGDSYQGIPQKRMYCPDCKEHYWIDQEV